MVRDGKGIISTRAFYDELKKRMDYEDVRGIDEMKSITMFNKAIRKSLALKNYYVAEKHMKKGVAKELQEVYKEGLIVVDGFGQEKVETNINIILHKLGLTERSGETKRKVKNVIVGWRWKLPDE